MNTSNPVLPRGTDAEISALIETLHRTGQRLEELTGGEVDAVADGAGHTFVLRQAQEHLREREAAKQAAILNALPANLALLDPHGIIISVNEAWRDFGTANQLHAPGHCVGVDYLSICDSAQGTDALIAAEVAAGIRSVLAGDAASFSIEYPCHSPAARRWFLMKATPLASGHVNGAVVMHVDVTTQRLAAEELERTHGHLVDASRQAGMAEVATNILHNVGNVLNSINISAGLALDVVRNPRAQRMTKVAAMVDGHQSDVVAYLTLDDEGRHVAAMLGQLSQDWVEQQQLLSRELGALQGNVDHVRRIVAVQQGYAKNSGAPELVNLRELVEDSLRMNADDLIGSHVRIVCRFEPVAPVSVEKHKVLQILVNLVRNARHACASADAQECVITLGITEVDGRIAISVADTGSGIAAENLVKIFAHGFTTRKDGHGFGLHSGALAAVELGGTLTALSEGPGKGATFTLDLPARREEAHG